MRDHDAGDRDITACNDGSGTLVDHDAGDTIGFDANVLYFGYELDQLLPVCDKVDPHFIGAFRPCYARTKALVDPCNDARGCREVRIEEQETQRIVRTDQLRLDIRLNRSAIFKACRCWIVTLAQIELAVETVSARDQRALRERVGLLVRA